MCVNLTEYFDEYLRLEHDLEMALRHVLCNLLIAIVEARKNRIAPPAKAA